MQQHLHFVHPAFNQSHVTTTWQIGSQQLAYDPVGAFSADINGLIAGDQPPQGIDEKKPHAIFTHVRIGGLAKRPRFLSGKRDRCGINRCEIAEAKHGVERGGDCHADRIIAACVELMR